MSEVDYEQEARSQGWKPLEEWDGDPAQHKSAEQFVKDGEQIHGILKSRLEKQSQEMEELRKRVDLALEANKTLNEMSRKEREREKKERDKLLSDLEEARARAVNEGDGSEFNRLDKQIQEVRSQDAVPTQVEPELDDNAKAFLENNKWYETNEVLGAYADGIADRLRAQGYSGKAYYDELVNRVKAAFPNEFENPGRKKPNTVEDGGQQEVSSGRKSFDDLPADAKAAYADMAKQIPGFTKKDYLAHYDWE